MFTGSSNINLKELAEVYSAPLDVLAKDAFSGEPEECRKWKQLFKKAKCLRNQGFLSAAIDICSEVIKECEKERSIYQKAVFLNKKGVILRIYGDIIGAEKCFNESLLIGGSDTKSRAFGNLGVINRHKKEYKEAMYSIEMSLNIIHNIEKSSVGFMKGWGFDSIYYGDIYVDMERYDRARMKYLEARNIMAVIGEHRGLGLTYLSIANMYFRMGRCDEVIRYCDAAVKSFDAYGKYVEGESQAYYLKGLSLMQKDRINAVACLHLSLEKEKKMKREWRIAEIKNILASGKGNDE